MRTEVFCEFRLESAHFLPNVPEGHKCRRVHGHSYRVIVTFDNMGVFDAKLGWLMDYAEVEAAWMKRVHSKLDHQVLNEVLKVENTTSEFLAHWIAAEMTLELGGGIVSVEVWETAAFGARWIA